MPWQREATADWQERFEALARAKKVEDNVIDGTHPTSGMTVFLTVVGNESYSQIKALLAPNLQSAKRYQDIKEAMKKHLEPKNYWDCWTVWVLPSETEWKFLSLPVMS